MYENFPQTQIACIMDMPLTVCKSVFYVNLHPRLFSFSILFQISYSPNRRIGMPAVTGNLSIREALSFDALRLEITGAPRQAGLTLPSAIYSWVFEGSCRCLGKNSSCAGIQGRDGVLSEVGLLSPVCNIGAPWS